MAIFLRKKLSISIFAFLVISATFNQVQATEAFPLVHEVAPQAHTVGYNDHDVDHQHLKELETITKIILVLKKTDNLKCSAEEKIIVNRLLDSVSNSFPKKVCSDKQNCELANKLRIIIQIFGISSQELDNARGSTHREETGAIVKALQNCLAQRNFTNTNRVVRSIISTIEPYKSWIAIGTLPIAAFCAYKLYGTMQDRFVSFINIDPLSFLGKWTTATDKTQNNSGTADKIKASPSPYALESWKLFSAALIVPPASDLYQHIKKTVLSPAVEQGSDFAKKIWAKLQGRPSTSSNPAAPSKIALQDVPAPAAIKEHIKALARMTVSQEEVYRQQGGAGLKTLLIHGDTSLALLLAAGLSHEVVQASKAHGAALACPIAVIHASKLTAKDAFKEFFAKITNYNQACVIVIQDIDWNTDSDSYSSIVREIVNGIKSATRPNEQYIVIGTARNLENVDPILRQVSIFGTKLSLQPSHDAQLLKACIERAEKLYGITITQDTLRTQLEKYICNNSFGDFMNLFTAAYTKSLPQVCAQPFDEYAIAKELALADSNLADSNKGSEQNEVE